MRLILSVFAFLIATVVASGASAQIERNVPPGGAIVLGPFSVSGATARISSFEIPSDGSAFLADRNTRLVYVAPTEVEAAFAVPIALNLQGETAPRSFTVTVDPEFSAQGESVIAEALKWLVLLLIFALFLEAAVLVCVALIRNWIRFWAGGPEGLGEDSYKPSVYKPVFALVLAIVAVFAFGLRPLSDIVEAFGNDPAVVFGSDLRWVADGLITILLLAGGAESVRRVATGIATGLNVPTAKQADRLAVEADTRNANE